MSFPGKRKQRGKAEPAERLSAFGKGIDLLSRREQSARELKGKLARKGYDKQETEEALEQLQRSSYQSDERFAEVLARSRASQGHGPRRIFAELKSHGIADALITMLQGAMAELRLGAADDPATAASRLRRRHRSRRHPRTAGQRERRAVRVSAATVRNG